MGEPNVNRRYFVQYVQTVAPPGAKVLDYGCGEGETVRLLRDAGYDAYGVDIAWPGADYGDLEATELGRENRLRYYEEGGPLPFPDNFFDVVISDQVLEHVVPLEESVRELERVVKPSGVMYHHFPSRAVVREGHIGIPLSHRLPKGRFRFWYTTLLRAAGLGIFKDSRPPRDWAEEKLDWIDNWVIYRPRQAVIATFSRRADVESREIDYCRFRAGDRRWVAVLLSWPFMRAPAEWLFRRLAFEAIEVRPRQQRRGPQARTKRWARDPARRYHRAHA